MLEKLEIPTRKFHIKNDDKEVIVDTVEEVAKYMTEKSTTPTSEFIVNGVPCTTHGQPFQMLLEELTKYFAKKYNCV